MNSRLFAAIILFLAVQSSALAYLDEILMTPAEVWTATKIVMEPDGLKVENKETLTLKSAWIEDYVRKEKNILPDKLGRGLTLPSTVRRRYQMRVVLKELPTGTQIQISGKYQERSLGAPEHQARWKFVKPSTEDYELERILFFKILREMARIKTSPN